MIRVLPYQLFSLELTLTYMYIILLGMLAAFWSLCRQEEVGHGAAANSEGSGGEQGMGRVQCCVRGGRWTGERLGWVKWRVRGWERGREKEWVKGGCICMSSGERKEVGTIYAGDSYYYLIDRQTITFHFFPVVLKRSSLLMTVQCLMQLQHQHLFYGLHCWCTRQEEWSMRLWVKHESTQLALNTLVAVLLLAVLYPWKCFKINIFQISCEEQGY